jgi:hypothetical protein
MAAHICSRSQRKRQQICKNIREDSNKQDRVWIARAVAKAGEQCEPFDEHILCLAAMFEYYLRHQRAPVHAQTQPDRSAS